MSGGSTHKAKSSKKNRKHGRNSAFCLFYKNTGRREKNKVKRLEKHLVAYSNDRCAVHCLANLKKDFAKAA